MKILMNKYAPGEMVTFHIAGKEYGIMVEKTELPQKDLDTWEDEGGSTLTEIEFKKLYEGDWSQLPEHPCPNCDGLGEVLYIRRWVDCAECEGKGYLNG